MNVDDYIIHITAAILAIFNIEATITHSSDGQDGPITLLFTVANPAPNQPDFVWPYELSPILLADTTPNGIEYRNSAVSGMVSRVVSDLLQQWLATQTARPIKQPIDQV